MDVAAFAEKSSQVLAKTEYNKTLKHNLVRFKIPNLTPFRGKL